MTTTVRISEKSRDLLEQMSNNLPGKPYLSKLVDDAIEAYYELLQEKYDLEGA